MERCLVRIRDALADAKTVLDGLLFCNSDLPSKISIWKVRFDALSQELETIFRYPPIQSRLYSVAPRAQRILQPVSDSEFVGAGIKSALSILTISISLMVISRKGVSINSTKQLAVGTIKAEAL